MSNASASATASQWVETVYGAYRRKFGPIHLEVLSHLAGNCWLTEFDTKQYPTREEAQKACEDYAKASVQEILTDLGDNQPSSTLVAARFAFLDQPEAITVTLPKGACFIPDARGFPTEKCPYMLSGSYGDADFCGRLAGFPELVGPAPVEPCPLGGTEHPLTWELKGTQP